MRHIRHTHALCKIPKSFLSSLTIITSQPIRIPCTQTPTVLLTLTSGITPASCWNDSMCIVVKLWWWGRAFSVATEPSSQMSTTHTHTRKDVCTELTMTAISIPTTHFHTPWRQTQANRGWWARPELLGDGL